MIFADVAHKHIPLRPAKIKSVCVHILFLQLESATTVDEAINIFYQDDKASLRQCIGIGRPLVSLQDRDIILGQLMTFLVKDNVSDAYDQ